jgi:hypothetical protein
MFLNTNSMFPMSDGELDNICSALRALKIEDKPDIPIQIEFDTLILRQSMNACIDKLRVVMFQFYTDHKRAVDDFTRSNHTWSFRYHGLSAVVSARKVTEYNVEEEIPELCTDITTHLSVVARYNIKDLYGNAPLDNAILEEITELYSDIKQCFSDYE